MMRFAVVSAVLAAAALSFGDRGHAQKPDDRPVRIGMIRSLFDAAQDEKQIFGQMEPFAEMVKKRTGVPGEFVVSANVQAMGREMQEGKMQLGVVHGIEYAWLKAHCPECKPLLVADVGAPTIKGVVLVPKASEAKGLADLKGMTLSAPRRLPMFAKLYMEREVKEEWNKYFKLSEAKNADDAIEEAVEGKAAAVLVTSTQAEVYKSRKPGRYNRLRVLTESIDFPTAVVVYRPTPGREKELAQFKDALLKSDQTAEGRQTLTLWRLDGFRELTKEFEATADFAGKKYPEK